MFGAHQRAIGALMDAVGLSEIANVAVSGADPIESREGFAALLDRAQQRT